MAPTIDSHTLDVGDEICDDTPECCGGDMTPGAANWTCQCCKTTILVDTDGCVDHISA